MQRGSRSASRAARGGCCSPTSWSTAGARRAARLLTEAVWPAGPPAAADSALNALLSKLRAVLGREAVTGKEEPRLVLPAGAFVDLEAAGERLHAAESAVAREDCTAHGPRRGPPCTRRRGASWPGTRRRGSTSVRRDLENLRMRALECVGATGLGLGGPELAAAERAGRALIDASPFHESGYLHLMRVLAARDNVAEALLVYDRLRTRLRDELGIVPSPRVQELHDELLLRGASPRGP